MLNKCNVLLSVVLKLRVGYVSFFESMHLWFLITFVIIPVEYNDRDHNFSVISIRYHNAIILYSTAWPTVYTGQFQLCVIVLAHHWVYLQFLSNSASATLSINHKGYKQNVATSVIIIDFCSFTSFQHSFWAIRKKSLTFPQADQK